MERKTHGGAFSAGGVCTLGSSALLSKKRSKKEPTRRRLFLVRVESLVCTVEVIGLSRFAGTGRDALLDALPASRNGIG